MKQKVKSLNPVSKLLNSPRDFNVGQCHVRFQNDNVILDSIGVISPEHFTIVMPKKAWLIIAKQIINEYKQEQENLK